MKPEIKRKLTCLAFTLAATTMMGATAANATPVYDITLLKPFAGRNINATSINDSRQVTGNMIVYEGPAPVAHAFVTAPITNVFDADAYARDPLHQTTNLYYRNLIDLGALGGTGSSGLNHIKSMDINNSGQVVGGDLNYPNYPSTSRWSTHAFISDPGTNALTQIDPPGGPQTLPSSYSQTIPYGINERGTVTGTYTTGSFNSLGSVRTHSFVGNATGTTDIGTLGGTNSWAKDINDSGQVTGSSDLYNDGSRGAFIWDAVNGMTDIGGLFPRYYFNGSSYGNAINNQGQVVGSSTVISYDSFGRQRYYTHAFLWDKINGMIDLGTLFGSGIGGNSVAVGINDHGQVIGYSDALTGSTRAFLWENGVMYGLMEELINVNQPLVGNIWSGNMGINNAGDIVVGRALFVRRHSGTVPEPAPLALLGLGLMGFGVMRKRRG